MRRFRFSTLAVLLLVISTLSAQTARLRGRVIDSSGAVLLAADVKVFQSDKLIKEGKTDGSGNFVLDVAPGEYRLEISATDFNPYRELVRVTPNMGALSIS